MKLQIKKLFDDAIVPTRAYKLDSGLDLYAYLDIDELTLQSLERKLIPTGIAIKLPEPVIVNTFRKCPEPNKQYDSLIQVPSFSYQQKLIYEAQIRPKSGLALKQGLGVLNSPGTIDSEYTGQIQVIVVNLSNEIITIKNKQKIAQLVVTPVIIPDLIEVTDFDLTSRGDNGFGSTGI